MFWIILAPIILALAAFAFIRGYIQDKGDVLKLATHAENLAICTFAAAVMFLWGLLSHVP